MMSDVPLEDFCSVFLLMLKVVKRIHFLWEQTSPFDLRTRMILCLPGDWIFGFGDYWQCLLTLLYCRLSPAVHPWPSGAGRKGGLLFSWTGVVGDKLLVEDALSICGCPGFHAPIEEWPWQEPLKLCASHCAGGFIHTVSDFHTKQQRNPGQQPATALTALIFLLALTFRALKN